MTPPFALRPPPLRELQRELALKQVDELMTGDEKEARTKELYTRAPLAAAAVWGRWGGRGQPCTRGSGEGECGGGIGERDRERVGGGARVEGTLAGGR